MPREALDYPRIAARVFNTPLMIEPGKLATILAVLGPRLGVPATTPAGGFEYKPPEVHAEAYKVARAKVREPGYLVFPGGIGLVPVVGTLLQRNDSMAEAYSGAVGYPRVEARILTALADPAVEELILEIDSPGGETAGLFDLADRIHAARGGKRITAVAAEFAASAAYVLASAADEIVLPRTGMVGSIGVVAAHYDLSGQLEQEGVVPTFVFAGQKKVDGNPFEPLSERARSDWQGDIDAIYELMTATVARFRGIDQDLVKATEAGMFMGGHAVRLGLADRVGTLPDVLSEGMRRRRSGSARASGGRPVQLQEDPPMTAAETPRAAAAAEKARLKAIMAHPRAEELREMVHYLAFESFTPADEACRMLDAAPKGRGSAAASGFRQMMREQGGARIAGQAPADEREPPQPNPAAIYGRRRAASGPAQGAPASERKATDDPTVVYLRRTEQSRTTS